MQKINLKACLIIVYKPRIFIKSCYLDVIFSDFQTRFSCLKSALGNLCLWGLLLAYMSSIECRYQIAGSQWAVLHRLSVTLLFEMLKHKSIPLFAQPGHLLDVQYRSKKLLVCTLTFKV